MLLCFDTINDSFRDIPVTVLPDRDSLPCYYLHEDSINYSFDEIRAYVTRQGFPPLLLSQDSINYSFDEIPACVIRQRFPPLLLSQD